MNKKTRSLAEMDDAHRRVGRYVSIALIVGEPQHWLYLKTIMADLLLPRERAALAFAAMRSLSEDDRLRSQSTPSQNGRNLDRPCQHFYTLPMTRGGGPQTSQSKSARLT